MTSAEGLSGTLSAWRPACEALAPVFPVKVPRGYLALIDPDDPDDPIARAVLPDLRELEPSSALLRDPLGEEAHSPVPRLVHRYPDRALVFATNACAVHCRFCTRRRLVGDGGGAIRPQERRTIVGYLSEHPGIREVIVSGGDPLLLGDGALASLLDELRSVPSVELLRLHTRIPAVLPSRVTVELARVLADRGPLFVVTHFLHPRELTDAALGACARLVDAGLPVGNQTVLLAGVNDDTDTLAELSRALLRARVRPYYLHQCDLIEGAEHFRTPLSRGVEIIDALRGHISGLAVPTFVVDLPGGYGKVPLSPDAVVRREPDRTILRGPFGDLVSYPEPSSR